MKKNNFKSFVCGFLAASIVFTLGAVAFAAASTAFSVVNINLNGKRVGSKGQTYRLVNGANAPYSMSYIDEKGGGTTYLPVRLISELLGIEIGYDNKTNTVLIGDNLQTYKPLPGLTLSLPAGFTAKYDQANADCYMDGGNVLVTCLSEDRSTVEGYYGKLTLQKYCQMVIDANKLSGSPKTDSYGNVYFDYQRSDGSSSFYYYAVVKESGSKFWLFNFICFSSDKNTQSANFAKWASKIAVD